MDTCQDIPRVTEVLKPFTTYQNVPPNILENACVRGTTVHSLCGALAKGAWLDLGTIDEDYVGYIKSFLAWFVHVDEVLVVEKRYSNQIYTGQIDFICKMKDGRTALVDLKTSSKPQKTYPLQMCAYKNLLSHHNVEVDCAIIVYLDRSAKDPTLDTIEFFEEYNSVWQAALTCWQYFHKRKKNGRSKSRSSHSGTNNVLVAV